jgi:hypothetical protein
MPNDDDLSAWFQRRTLDIAADRANRAYRAWQSLGPSEDSGEPDSQLLQVSAVQPAGAKPYPKLRGRPGMQSQIAGIVNAITASPNSTAKYQTDGHGSATVARDAGGGVRAHFDGPPSLDASGMLAPPSDHAEVVVKDIQGPHSVIVGSFPRTARIFTGNDGQLRYEIHPGIRMPLVDIQEGIHRF